MMTIKEEAKFLARVELAANEGRATSEDVRRLLTICFDWMNAYNRCGDNCTGSDVFEDLRFERENLGLPPMVIWDPDPKIDPYEKQVVV